MRKDITNQFNALSNNDEIIPSRINLNNVQTIANDLKQINCDAFILGCTELPEVYNEKNLGKPVVDTTRLLAQRALEYALDLWLLLLIVQLNKLTPVFSNSKMSLKT